MKVLHIGILGVVLVLLAGCNTLGLGNKHIDYRDGAAQAPSLEVPPDLTSPGRDERYRMAQGDNETVATYSDYNKSGAPATQERHASTVLPQTNNVTLERNGAKRWLVVKDKPENVWLVTRAFLQENGWPIKSEDQAAGVMETDWAENRPNTPRSWFGKVLDKLNSTGERDKFRLRLERGKDGVSTEIYITHHGMEISYDGDTSKWQTRPEDPELEAAVLQRLMVRFGGSEARVDSGAESTTTAGTPGQAGAATLKDLFDGSRIILVDDAFDRSWRRVGLAIERAGLVVEDKDRARGIYFLRPAKVESGWMDKIQIWKNSTGTRYLVKVKDGGKACEVSVTEQDGSSGSTTNQMIDTLYKNIDHGETSAVQAPASSIKATGSAGTASLLGIFDGSSVIVLNDAFDRSWNRIGLAIERAGLVVESKDRARGIYFLRPAKAETGWMDKIQIWKDSADTRYRVNVKDGGKACEVSVTDHDGISNDAAKQMIEAIYKNINQ